MVSLIQLEYIVAIDNYRHFAQAADHCFVTQPTLSMQVKKMEDDLGVKIFDRSKQPVVPTDIGLRIIEQARITLYESGKINELVRQFTGDVSGDLSIGIIPTLSPYLLPLFAGNFKRKYPHVNIRIEELLTNQIAEKLKTDQLDAGIFVTPFNDQSIVEQPVFYEELLGYAHPDHPLLTQEKVEINDVTNYDVWLLGDGHCFRNQVINLCSASNRINHELPFGFESGSLETLIRLINREGGFTIIPELAIAEGLNVPQTQIFRFSQTKPIREISICYSRLFTKRRLIQLLADEIAISVPKAMLNRNRGELVNWK
jgi:LysR family hydrogen peroxide-inducible transcriptional activator